jgi:hypothetical protein
MITAVPPAAAPNLCGTFNKHDRVLFGQSMLFQSDVWTLFSHRHWVFTGNLTNAAVATPKVPSYDDAPIPSGTFNRHDRVLFGQSMLFQSNVWTLFSYRHWIFTGNLTSVHVLANVSANLGGLSMNNGSPSNTPSLLTALANVPTPQQQLQSYAGAACKCHC